MTDLSDVSTDHRIHEPLHSFGNAPVKVNPPPPPPTRAIAGNCGDLNLFSLDFDPPVGGKSAQIHDLRLQDQGVSGDFTIR